MEIKLTDALNNLVFFVLVLVTKTSGRSSGPPVKDYFSLVCEQMTPSPTAHGAPRPGDGGYRISIDPPMEKTPDGFIYSPGKPYSCELQTGCMRICLTKTLKSYLEDEFSRLLNT